MKKSKIMTRNEKPQEYTVKSNGAKFPAFRLSLNNKCGFEDGQKVFEVLRPDGVLEIWPADKINLSDYD